MSYRREIDGLRAIAVLPVIFFHAGFEPFAGGFVGVDVFFVISGYLITNTILTELTSGEFSLLHFYERRARRILPALYLVILVCLPIAWLTLPPNSMKNFAQSLAAISLFSSNFLFWMEQGYFDAASELKPLLHTWSLAVEEQFYFFYPIFLVFLWRRLRRKIERVLALTLLLSFALAQWLVHLSPLAAFYLLPTRAWELLIGAMACIYLLKFKRHHYARATNEIGGSVGLLLILFSIVAYDQKTEFPGVFALTPTLGTALIIVFATQQTLTGRLLGHKPLVGLGLMSYSFYLWHQPLFVFARHIILEEPDLGLMLALVLLAFFFAYLTWRFVEIPFRRRDFLKQKLIFQLALAGCMTLLLLGAYGHLKGGFPSKELLRDSKLTDQNFIVIGDSHGGHLVSGISSATTGEVLSKTSMGCIPLRNVDRYDSRFKPGECARQVNQFLDEVIFENPDAIVVLSSMGPVYLDGVPFNGKDFARVNGLGVELITDKSIKDRYKVYEIGLRQTLEELSALSNPTVVFAIDVPELGIDFGCSNVPKKRSIGNFDLGDVFDSQAFYKRCFVPRQEYDQRVRAYKELVVSVVAEFPKVVLFDPSDYFCDREKCKGYDEVFGFLYRDFDHLSESGSRYFAESLVKFLGIGQS
jgi:peptidoglycan/LPS O-acetylase OafA/YrhL